MRSTFTKIFLSFWLTQALILVATFFLMYKDFQQTQAVYTSTFALMEANARQQLNAYDKGGCPALLAVPSVFSLEGLTEPKRPAILIGTDGSVLCREVDLKPYAPLLAKEHKYSFLLPENFDDGYVQGMDVRNSHGQKYVYFMHGGYPKDVYIPYREMLPRLAIALVISLFVTSLITILITRPIGHLRIAARELAGGNLHARVKTPKGKKGPSKGDELQALVFDFNNMADRLESLVDAQMLLLRDVSHELRSPLARLSVALELAREEAQPGMEEQLARIERETARLNTLIGQLLSLSHLESTHKLPDGAKVELGALVEDLVPDMEYEARGRNCHVSFAAHAPIAVLGNRELLGRAIENVIRNAIAYTAEGTSVEITLRREELVAGDFAVLAVRDHGPGVPADGLRSIFRPFYRLDLSRQRSTGGYGVGLAITERAIRLHGGEVEASNAEGGGLTVTMRFPLEG
jgi:two-component system sensor histidine kinase CpxA